MHLQTKAYKKSLAGKTYIPIGLDSPGYDLTKKGLAHNPITMLKLGMWHEEALLCDNTVVSGGPLVCLPRHRDCSTRQEEVRLMNNSNGSNNKSKSKRFTLELSKTKLTS